MLHKINEEAVWSDEAFPKEAQTTVCRCKSCRSCFTSASILL